MKSSLVWAMVGGAAALASVAAAAAGSAGRPWVLVVFVALVTGGVAGGLGQPRGRSIMAAALAALFAAFVEWLVGAVIGSGWPLIGALRASPWFVGGMVLLFGLIAVGDHLPPKPPRPSSSLANPIL